MAKNIKTYIFCFDDHRGFSEDVKKRYAETPRYRVFSYPATEELLNHIKAEKDRKYCKIAILGAHDTKEQNEMINQLAFKIKQIDQHTGIIILGQADKIEEIEAAMGCKVDAYIPKNSNSVLRIHNIVKKLNSEFNIGIFRKRRNISLYVLLTFLLVSALLILLAYFRLPQYF